MFSVGICDDEKFHRDYIRGLCERFFSEYPQQHEFIDFTSGEEVLAYQKGKLHLLFLDVEMGEIDGVEVLQRVEDADWIWRIVFVSNHAEAVWKAFSIKTLEFARKPIDYHQIEKWLKVAMRENRENVVIEYLAGTQKSYRAVEDIYYLEAAGNYTYLHDKSESELVNDNLKHWLKKTEQMSLVRIHKSYIINMQHVKKWEADKVTLENRVKLTVGRQFAKDAKERYLIYVRKQAFGRM